MSTATTNPGTSTVLHELKAKQHRIWSSGDYNKIAAITVPVSEALIGHLGVRPGSRILDVATGTGHAALAAARQFGHVTGVDYVDTLVDIARRRAAAEDLDVEFVEGDAENLPFADESFDDVVSAIGVMFTADHPKAAAELVRVTRRGGRIGLASWTRTGFVGGILAAVGRHVSPPAGAQPPVRWADPEVVGELLGEQAVDVQSVTRTVTQRFASPEAFADYFLAYYGPTHMAARALGEAERAALRADLVAHATANSTPSGAGIASDWEYRIVTATRR